MNEVPVAEMQYVHFYPVDGKHDICGNNNGTRWNTYKGHTSSLLPFIANFRYISLSGHKEK